MIGNSQFHVLKLFTVVLRQYGRGRMYYQFASCFGIHAVYIGDFEKILKLIKSRSATLLVVNTHYIVRAKTSFPRSSIKPISPKFTCNRYKCRAVLCFHPRARIPKAWMSFRQ